MLINDITGVWKSDCFEMCMYLSFSHRGGDFILVNSFEVGGLVSYMFYVWLRRHSKIWTVCDLWSMSQTSEEQRSFSLGSWLVWFQLICRILVVTLSLAPSKEIKVAFYLMFTVWFVWWSISDWNLHVYFSSPSTLFGKKKVKVLAW